MTPATSRAAEALQPFADAASDPPNPELPDAGVANSMFTAGQLRRARAALRALEAAQMPEERETKPMTENAFYGWYDDASQPPDQPTYDPPHDGPCLYCGKPLLPDDVRTHSLMYAGQYGARSYFYRTHRTCDEWASIKGSDLQVHKDGTVLDMILRNGD